MLSVILCIAIPIIIISGAIVAQVFLSKAQSKWFGLILPIAWFMLSVVIMLLSLVWAAIFPKIPNWDVNIAVLIMVTIFIAFNIPTVIFMVIYFAHREQFKTVAEITDENTENIN